MNHRIAIDCHGGPEVLRWEAVDVPPPGTGEVRIRQQAVGVNFIDTYHRSGLYPLALPSGLGLEAAGVIEAVGEGVSGFAVGDRVGYTSGPLGAYAEVRNLDVRHVLKLPSAIRFEQAAAMLLQGITAHYLVHDSYPVRAGDNVLVHAAAGGVGSLLVQWAKLLGARVIGTVGSAAKAERALALGCDEVIQYREEAFAPRVRALTGGEGVAVVYDAIGHDTFADSLSCLRRRGMMVSFGNATGPVAPFTCAQLQQGGSLYVTRPMLGDYIASREELEQRSAALFEVVGSGQLRIDIGQHYPLREAAQAHRDLEARQTTGASVLLV